MVDTTLPTSDQAFGSNLPTADEAFGAPQKPQTGLFSGEFADTFFSHDAASRVISAFGQGAKEGWGDDLGKLTKESDSWLSHVGVYNDYSQGRTNFIKSLNETFMRPLIYTGITAGKVIQAGMTGIQKATDVAGQVLKDQAQLNQPTLIPKPILGLGSEVLQATASGYIPDIPHFTLSARSQAVIGEGEEGFFNTHPVTEGQLQQRTQAAAEAGVEPPRVEPPELDLNVIARKVNPDAFAKYDALLDQQENLRLSREYLKSLQQDRESPTFDYKEQQRVSEQLQDIPSRLLEIDQKLRDFSPTIIDTRQRLQYYLESDSPEAEIFRKYVQSELINNAIERDNLSGPVKDAYTHAESLLPKEPLPSPGDLQKPVEFNKSSEGTGIPVQGERPVEASEVSRKGIINEPQRTTSLGPAEQGLAKATEGGPGPVINQVNKEASRAGNESNRLSEIEGTGKVKKVGLAQKVEQRAREQGLTEGFPVQERQQVSLKDQAQKAVDLVQNNFETARDIALGRSEAPEGVIPEMVFNAIEQDALEKGNVETLRQLANSTLSRESSTMALRLRALAERERENPVEAIRAVEEARRQGLPEQRLKDTVQGIRKALETAPERMTKEMWTDWIKTIECDY
jgi:hypothetical protein